MPSSRPRSPNYPALSVAEAIQKAREFYSQEKTAFTPPEVAVTAWGFKGVNGSSARVLAALRQYGLLESGDQGVRLSPRGLTILLEEPDTDDYKSAILEAIWAPTIFAEMREEFADGLPSDQGLIANLVRRRGFTEEGAKQLNVVLRDNMMLAESNSVRYAKNAANSVVPGASHPQPSRVSTGSQRSGEGLDYSFSVPGKGAMRLSYEGKALDDEDLELLTDWFALTTRALARQLRRPPQSNTNEAELGESS